MAVDFGSSNTDRNYTVEDSARLSLPAYDWTWLVFFNPNDNTGFPYFLSYGGTYGASNSIQCFNNGGSGWAVKVAALTDQNWGGGALTIGSWHVGYASRRNGNLYAGAGLVGDPSSVSESGGTSISTAYNPTGQLKIGIRSDLSSDATYATKSIISDCIFLPGVGFTTDMLEEILKGQYLDRSGWWHKRNFHAYLPYAKEFLIDLTGHHALTRNGSGYTRGATEKDSSYRRISSLVNISPLVTSGAATQNLTPSLFEDGDTFYSATVTTGAVTLTPSLFSDGDTFHSATVSTSTTLTPSLYTDSDTFHSATVSTSTTLTASLFTDSDTFYSATVSPGSVTLTPSLYSDADTFYSATVSQGSSPQELTPSLFADDDTFYTATVSPGAVALTASLFADSDSFYTPTVSATYDLTPALYSDSDTFYTSTITTGAVTLTPSLYDDGDTFYTHTIGLGGAAQELTPSLFTDADTFYTATVTTGAVTLSPSLFADDDTFYAATVLPGAVTLTPSLFSDSDTFYASTVSSTYALTPALYTDSDSFYVPVVSVGAVTLTASLFSDDDTFYAHTITGGGALNTPLSRTFSIQGENRVYSIS